MICLSDPWLADGGGADVSPANRRCGGPGRHSQPHRETEGEYLLDEIRMQPNRQTEGEYLLDDTRSLNEKLNVMVCSKEVNAVYAADTLRTYTA